MCSIGVLGPCSARSARRGSPAAPIVNDVVVVVVYPSSVLWAALSMMSLLDKLSIQAAGWPIGADISYSLWMLGGARQRVTTRRGQRHSGWEDAEKGSCLRRKDESKRPHADG